MKKYLYFPYQGNWSCSNGICIPDTEGIYTSKAQCNASRIQYITASRSGTGAIDGSTEGVIDPEDSIPQIAPGFAPYTSEIIIGSTRTWGGSQWRVRDVNGNIVDTTSGYYTYYIYNDAGVTCPS
jgi:hypothetical protein